MATTVDHLGPNRHITIIQDFRDAAGLAFRAGTTGCIREIQLDRRTFAVTLLLESDGRTWPILLHDRHGVGPRNGNLRQYFALNEASPDIDPEDFPSHNPAPAEPPVPLPASLDDSPSWYQHAARLLAQGLDEDARQVVFAAVPSIHCAMAMADLYRNHWRQLHHSGNAAQAEAARQQSASWAFQYASWATSGGEGAALSYERDQFLKTLGKGPWK